MRSGCLANGQQFFLHSRIITCHCQSSHIYIYACAKNENWVTCFVLLLDISRSCNFVIFAAKYLTLNQMLFSFERVLFDEYATANVTDWVDWNVIMYLQLNDLMIMAVKYQVFLCKRPQDLLLITLNHIDEIRKFMFGDSHALDLLDHTYLLLHNVRRVDVLIRCYLLVEC